MTLIGSVLKEIRYFMVVEDDQRCNELNNCINLYRKDFQDRHVYLCLDTKMPYHKFPKNEMIESFQMSPDGK